MRGKLEEIEDELRKGRVKGSFGRCLGLTMRRLRGEEGAWGSGLLMMMRGWGRLRRWVFSFSLLFSFETE